MSIYKKCLDATVWGDKIAAGGLYTVFAPTDDAFESFFASHPKYKTFDDMIGTEEDSLFLDGLVRYSIILNGWSRYQLTNMAIGGFYDSEEDDGRSIYDKPIAFKHQTLYEQLPQVINVEENVVQQFGSSTLLYDQILRSPSGTSVERTIIPDGKKYVPLFYQNYFQVFNYGSDDYEFFFNRVFDPGEVYYAGAQILKLDDPNIEDTYEIFAENGFLYKIDKVVEPLYTIYDAMGAINGGATYSNYLDLLNSYGTLNYEEAKTKEQAGYAEGLAGVKDLYSVSLPTPVNREGISYTEEYNMFFQTSSLAPTNEAFQWLIDNVVTRKSGYPRWNTFDDAPYEVKTEIMSSYIANDIVYKKEVDRGFLNLAGDSVQLTDAEIEDVMYCSNGTFIGVNKPIIPKAFTSVVAPIFLRQGFEAFRRAMSVTNMLDEVKRSDRQYSLFAIDGNTTATDSSLLLETIIESNGNENQRLLGYDMSFDPPAAVYMNKSILQPIIMNQICEGTIEGMASYEFLRTLGGYYLRVDNINHTLRGSSSSVIGYNGSNDTITYYEEIDASVDGKILNGKTYTTNVWFSFSSAPSTFSVVRETGRSSGSSLNNRFIDLCIKAGLATDNGFVSTEISPTEFFTVFVPSDQAISEYEELENLNLAADLSQEELKNFLLYHFVRGEIIFTDGKVPSGSYNTLRRDESSTDLFPRNSKMAIETGYDYISVLGKDGDAIYTVEPQILSSPNASFSTTNKIGYARITDPSVNNNITTFAIASVHGINSVLVYEK